MKQTLYTATVFTPSVAVAALMPCHLRCAIAKALTALTQEEATSIDFAEIFTNETEWDDSNPFEVLAADLAAESPPKRITLN